MNGSIELRVYDETNHITKKVAVGEKFIEDSNQPSTPTRGSSLTTSSPLSKKRKQCNCRNSKCLKLYCECFSGGYYCDGCNCRSCFNTADHTAERREAIEATLDRNPNAFRPKIATSPVQSKHSNTLQLRQIHNKGCHCKKSGCLKKYCECFQAGVYCSGNCKCKDCKNISHEDQTQPPSALLSLIDELPEITNSNNSCLLESLSDSNLSILTKSLIESAHVEEVKAKEKAVENLLSLYSPKHSKSPQSKSQSSRSTSINTSDAPISSQLLCEENLSEIIPPSQNPHHSQLFIDQEKAILDNFSSFLQKAVSKTQKNEKADK